MPEQATKTAIAAAAPSTRATERMRMRPLLSARKRCRKKAYALTRPGSRHAGDDTDCDHDAVCIEEFDMSESVAAARQFRLGAGVLISRYWLSRNGLRATAFYGEVNVTRGPVDLVGHVRAVVSG